MFFRSRRFAFRIRLIDLESLMDQIIDFFVSLIICVLVTLLFGFLLSYGFGKLGYVLIGFPMGIAFIAAVTAPSRPTPLVYSRG